MIRYIQAQSNEDIERVRKLFLEYAKSLNFELCFQGFEKELSELPGVYSPPGGRLYLAIDGSNPVGCVGLRKLEDGICEMKRLFVKPERRREGTGRELAEMAIRAAKDIGYLRMRLDTVSTMKEALSLYHSLGFKETPPYRYNPLEGAVYLELEL